jgi:hypothetical protein
LLRRQVFGRWQYAHPFRYLSRLERVAIVSTLDNLKSSSWSKAASHERQLQLIGAYFDVGSGGQPEAYDQATGVLTAMTARGGRAAHGSGRLDEPQKS